MRIGNGTFLHGDCLARLAEIPDNSLDAVITSPPYNLREGNRPRTGHKGSAWENAALGRGYASHGDDMPYPEYCAWQKQILDTLWRKVKETGAIFYNHKPRQYKGELRLPIFSEIPLRQIIIWDRQSRVNYQPGAFCPVHEYILLFAKPKFYLKSKKHGSPGDVWRFAPDHNNPHPAPFPVELPARILEAIPGEIVLDPFMGSGSVALAAEQAGWNWVGIEKDEGYYWNTVARLMDNGHGCG